MKRMAKTANPKIRPFRPRGDINSSDVFIAFVPSLVLRDLRADTTFIQANRDARERGKSNPLFAGADYIYDNILIYEIEDIPVLSGVGASSIDVAPMFLCGAQALGMVWAEQPITVTEEFDYKRYVGISIQQWYEIEKIRWGTGTTDTDDPKDHGVLTGYFAAVADA